MTPADLAALHGRCFVTPRPFSESEFAALLDTSSVFLCATAHGFALGRALAGEAELLTLAVDPDARRQGTGRRLMADFHDNAVQRGAETVFLEVAEDNAAARALYTACGYVEVGRRKAYYRHPDGSRVDALVMQKALSAA
ncbi:GNAT family N-acetyltransferase [Psychromarinibacter sp. S121]|uniref:GNAT family N-acetyltransferase n=1 Tax=Psychromarinibacter sp. S121 TaxID=3415127 RepID=UPI003C7C7CF9